jgi:DNA polymerase-3 subunit epsilon
VRVRAGLSPARRTSWRDARWCAVDFELTGLDPRRDEIISFGAVPIDGGRLRLGEAVSGLIRPRQDPGEESIRVHGIRATDLRQAPRLNEGLTPLLRTLAGRTLVAHTESVERAFLKAALRRLNHRLRVRMADTEVLGQLWLYRRDGVLPGRLSLGRLASELGLPADRPHDALGDALTTAQVFIALCTHAEADGEASVGKLIRARRRRDALRTFHVG